MFKSILKKTEVKKNLIISVIGIGIGQLVHIGTTPIISRIYSPETFGQFSLFNSFFGILTALCLMKFELAIIAAKDSEVGVLNDILKIVGRTIMLLTGAITVGVYFYKNPYFSIFLFLTVIIYISNRFWTQRAILNREKNFKALSLGKIAENVSNGAITIGLAFTIFKDIGLFVGKISGLFISLILFKFSSKGSYPVDKNKRMEILKTYQNYPKFSFPAELVAHISQSSSIFLFAYFFTPLEVGFIGLTTRVLSVPANFISVSFFDVFKQKAVQDYNEFGSFRTIFNKFFFILFGLGFSMVLLIGTTGPDLFSFVFGDEWRKAGEYAVYLTILYAVKLVAVPLIFSLEIVNKHKIGLYFNISYLIVSLIITPIMFIITKNDLECIKYYSISLTIIHILHIYQSFLASGKSNSITS